MRNSAGPQVSKVQLPVMPRSLPLDRLQRDDDFGHAVRRRGIANNDIVFMPNDVSGDFLTAGVDPDDGQMGAQFRPIAGAGLLRDFGAEMLMVAGDPVCLSSADTASVQQIINTSAAMPSAFIFRSVPLWALSAADFVVCITRLKCSMPPIS